MVASAPVPHASILVCAAHIASLKLLVVGFKLLTEDLRVDSRASSRGGARTIEAPGMPKGGRKEHRFQWWLQP